MGKSKSAALILGLCLAVACPASAAPNIFLEHDVTGGFVYPNSLLAADVDQDGDTDLVAAGGSLYGADGIRWLENDGAGNFTHHDITDLRLGTKMNLAPMDLDGDLDLVAGAGSYGWGFTWWERGPAGFVAHDIDPPAGDYEFSTWDTFPGDLDGDGDVDVAVAGGQEKGNSFAWWENQGATWVRHIVTGARIDSRGVRVVDLDGDGDRDILLFFVANVPTVDTPGAIVWWEALPGGAYAEHLIGNTGLVEDAFPVDLDHDHDLDLLTADTFPAGFTWWMNDGAQNFTAVPIKSMAQTTSIGAADLDGDGDLDIYGTEPGDWSVFWFENDGHQGFTQRPVVEDALNSSWCAQAADFNHDGVLDLAAVSDITSKIVWWENELPANTSFETGPRVPAWWTGRNLGLADGQNDASVHSGHYSFKVGGSAAAKSLSQTLNISGKAGDSFAVGGWSRSRGTLAAGGAYALEAKVFHADGTAKAYKAAFPKASHPWQYREKAFTAENDYDRIVISLKYANQAGKAWFDDLGLRLR